LGLGIVALVLLALAPAAASAALWTSTPSGAWNCDKPNNGCVAHTGFNPNREYWGQAPNPLGNCTNYAAYRLQKNGAQKPAGLRGGAAAWREKIELALGRSRVNSTPAVGSIAWWPKGAGHVAYVEKIVNGAVYLSDSSFPIRRGIGGSERYVLRRGDPQWPKAFLHIKDKPAGPKKPKPKKPKPKKAAKPDPVNVIGTYLPVPGDFNGDGNSDVFWYGPGDEPDSIWYGASTRGSFSKGHQVTVTGTYSPVPGDFNGDNFSDVFWYGPGDTADSIWFGTATQGSFATGYQVPVIGTYSPVPGDFNGDNFSDVIWYGSGAVPDSLWSGTPTRGSFDKFSGTTVTGTYSPVPGDFNGDNFSDVFWYGPGGIPDSLWYGTATKGSFATGY
jgi:surface antigen